MSAKRSGGYNSRRWRDAVWSSSGDIERVLAAVVDIIQDGELT